jgi:hypothetical protein
MSIRHIVNEINIDKNTIFLFWQNEKLRKLKATTGT